MLDETDKNKSDKMFEQIQKEEDFSDELELAIAGYLEKVSDAHLSDDTQSRCTGHFAPAFCMIQRCMSSPSCPASASLQLF